MAIYVRPFVTSITHVAGCRKLKCGPECARETNGWEYHIKLVLPTGDFFEERKKSPVNGKANTQRYAEERAAHAVRASVAPQTAVKMRVLTVSEFQEQFMTFSKTNNKPSTVSAKEGLLRVHLIPFFGSMKLDAIGPAEVESYKASKLDEDYEKKSINNHLTAFRKLLNLAVEWGALDRAPKVRGFKLKHQYVSEDEYLTFQEASRVIVAAAPQWQTFIIVALKTGLRVGELLALKWQDIDLVAGHLIVRRTLWRDQEGPPKGGLNRKVPLSDGALAALKSHRHLQGPYVFCAPSGERLTHSMVKDVVPDACRRAGLGKRITTHGLRHTFASHLIMRGASLKAVQELLGHESIEMTLRYSHLTPDVKREAVRLLDRTEKSGDIQETAEAEKETPRRSGGLDGAGKGI
jgi:integrase